MNFGKSFKQIWFIGRTLASQAGEVGSIPIICSIEFSYIYPAIAEMRRPHITVGSLMNTNINGFVCIVLIKGHYEVQYGKKS